MRSSSILGLSYNQPKFTGVPTWGENATTFASVTTVGSAPYGLFVDKNNTVYVSDSQNSRVQIWSEGSYGPTRNLTVGLFWPYSVFATTDGNIYVDNGYSYNRVDVWKSNGTKDSRTIPVERECYGLFVDTQNNLYCSVYDEHQVTMTSLDSNSNMWTIAAGTSCYGSDSNTLLYPWGIFVDTDLNLFVADCGNDRVQKFLSNQVSAITVAGNGAAGTISLTCPSGVILDNDGYLFISDSSNHRVVASGPNGFRCIVGCSMVGGSLSSQLYYPSDLKFDSYGNIYVTDTSNGRVQKFLLMLDVTYRKYFSC